MKTKVTIQDIADALGISRNTVSKAINNSEGLAEATREKILQKAVEMGYKQFSYVSAMASGTAPIAGDVPQSSVFQGEIALFTTVFLTQSHFASLMLDRFQRELSQLGYTLNTHRIDSDNIRNLSLPITFVPSRCSAVICIEMFNQEYDEMVCSLGIPVLFVDGPSRRNGRSLPCDQLYMDNTTEVTRFVHEMLQQGQRRIGFVGNYDHCQSFFERYTAFRCTMLLEDECVDERYIIKSNRLEDIEEKLTLLTDLPDVFLCANDFVAGDVVNVLSRIGKHVPEDVRICGFDDSPESRLQTPQLTTIHIHTQIMAFSALHLLISRIREPSLDFRTIYTETNLIYRESTRLVGGT